MSVRSNLNYGLKRTPVKNRKIEFDKTVALLGIPVICVSHSMAEINELTDTVILIDKSMTRYRPVETNTGLNPAICFPSPVRLMQSAQCPYQS